MRRFLKWTGIGAASLVGLAILFVVANVVYAQMISGNTDYNNMFFFNTNCSTMTPRQPGLAGFQVCFDTTHYTVSVWNGSSMIGVSSEQLIIKSPTTMCTTSNTVGAVCAEPTVTFVPGFADSSYAVNCTCAAVGTNVPVVASVAKSTNAVVVTVAALTAASASCSEVDCVASHP